MPEEDDLPRLLSGRYRLEATLGHGGMGVVYRGVDLMMKRPIAVKLIRAVDGVELDDEIAGRFLREAKNTARLQHEHIIEVFDLGRGDDGGLYFVMELLEGDSLSARLRRDGQLGAMATVHIGRQICEALQVAHTAGIIHRDLKPANIMLVSRAGDDDFVKVLDFGVAKSYAADQDTQLTHTGMLVGTVDYMAPEQIMGKPVDGRTDIYALGVVLYKMLSGKAPFRDGGVPALIHAHLNTMPKPLIEVAKGVPNELDHVVLRCLAKSPDRRYESMAELARALMAAVGAPEVSFGGTSGLIDLEYGAERGDDPYGADDDRTAMGRSFFDRLPEDATVSDGMNDVAFEDATMKIDRPFVKSPRPVAQGLPMTPRGGLKINPRASQAEQDETAILRSDEFSAARRSLPEEITHYDRSEPKTCAMCQTVNAPHARACLACGVSLASDDQDAVRVRVRNGPPRTAHAPAPHMPPPTSTREGAPHGGFEGLEPFHGHPHYPPHPSGSYGTPSPMYGVPSVPWPPHPQPPPPSAWDRFLLWTGLKSR